MHFHRANFPTEATLGWLGRRAVARRAVAVYEKSGPPHHQASTGKPLPFPVLRLVIVTPATCSIKEIRWDCWLEVYSLDHASRQVNITTATLVATFANVWTVQTLFCWLWLYNTWQMRLWKSNKSMICIPFDILGRKAFLKSHRLELKIGRALLSSAAKPNKLFGQLDLPTN